MPPLHHRIAWNGVGGIPAYDYTCGHCGREVASASGWMGQAQNLNSQGEVTSRDGTTPYRVLVCPRCGAPTYFADDRQVPGVPFGQHIEYLPGDVDELYEEARRSMSAGNYNAAAMLGRKLLMNVAVTRGAREGGAYGGYVDFLADEGVVTASMKEWIAEIRELGNDANHELTHVTLEEAEALLTFVAMLLQIVYEYPRRGQLSVEARAAKATAEAESSGSA